MQMALAQAVMVQNNSWEVVLRATAHFPQEFTAEYLAMLPVDDLADVIITGFYQLLGQIRLKFSCCIICNN